MGTMFLGEIKKKASGFLQDKYKSARLALTDVTEAELMAEEATNSEPWGPDARTMTKLAEASFDIDDYWRIVDILHRRFYCIDWKEWRQSYKALALLDFLLTHGPDDFAEEFQCDIDIIEELGSFKHIDGKGFNWGANMQKKSERIVKLLKGGDALKEARLKALKITKEIQGFGNLMASPSSSTSSATTATSRTSSFGSYSTSSSVWNEVLDEHPNKTSMPELKTYSHGGLPSERPYSFSPTSDCTGGTPHLWDSPIHETGSLLDDEDDEKLDGSIGSRPIVVSGTSRWDNGKAFIRSFSDTGREIKKKFTRQFSTRY